MLYNNYRCRSGISNFTLNFNTGILPYSCQTSFFSFEGAGTPEHHGRTGDAAWTAAARAGSRLVRWALRSSMLLWRRRFLPSVRILPLAARFTQPFSTRSLKLSRAPNGFKEAVLSLTNALTYFQQIVLLLNNCFLIWCITILFLPVGAQRTGGPV